jgi:chromate transporter
MQEEMANETQRATLFIIDREIEAPQRFQAIQTHRAALAVLRRQIDFIEGLRSAGVLDASERDVLRAPVDRRVRRLELRGPFWKAPSVRQVLLSLPFLAHAPPEMFELVMSQGRLKSTSFWRL